jgi:hypothetical protein
MLLVRAAAVVHRGSGNIPEHAGEDEIVQRRNPIPVDQTKQTERIKNCSLPDLATALSGRDFEFQPSSPGEFHFSREPQATIRFEFFDSPAIYRVAGHDGFLVAATSANADPANEQVHESAHGPEPITVIPTGFPSDTSNRRESIGWQHGDDDRA